MLIRTYEDELPNIQPSRPPYAPFTETKTPLHGTTLSCSFWSTKDAPASDRYPWLGTRQERPKQQGQQTLWSHLVHLGWSWMEDPNYTESMVESPLQKMIYFRYYCLARFPSSTEAAEYPIFMN
ncbi:hypothetical protein E2C01_010707 [Portunus trituberculatus]|uniref:Uncharacterized protein n=1 Tax=Portunus trituberculatus TaxID=210409 RepID=A0A5B7D944_PORTR|nr:hypothetical protein [Portunus trituberculatus]